jgi:short-subunit dehydrogenase
MSDRRPTALITGATSGIGYELGILLAKGGHDLVLVARSHDTLEAIASEWRKTYGISVKVLPRDLSALNAADEIVQALAGERIEVDILVNNAGFGGHGPFATTNLANELQMIQVNITALTHLTKLLLPGMLARKCGRILNVSSTAAFQPGPFMAVYYASKAYVLSFTEALGEELRGSGVTVTALCPGPVKTAFQQRAGVHDTLVVRSGMSMDVKPVAAAAYAGMMRGRRIVIPGLLNRIGVQSLRIAPRALILKAIIRLHK